jgi:transposase
VLVELTDEQWALLRPLLPKPRVRRDGRGRPWRDPRDVLNGILWVLRTGAPWRDLPPRFPPYQTCHRRLQMWSHDGTLKRVLGALYAHLRTNGVEDIEGFIDGTYAGAKKGDLVSGVAVPAARRKSWRLQTAMVFLSPLASGMVRDMTSPS